MRSITRIFPCILLTAALAAPLATTGCQQQPAPEPAPVASPTPAAAPANDDATYRRWENETHREHRELEKRTEDEKRQFEQWRRDHEHDRH